MDRAPITDEQLSLWAERVIDHCLGGVEPQDVVMIRGENVAWPLISALQDRVIQGGAVPDVWLVPPDNDRGRVWGAAMARHGTQEQIERVPAWYITRYQAMTKYIEVLGAEEPSLFTNLPRDMEQAIIAVDEPFKNLRLNKRWTLTLYPTSGFAEMEGLSLADYTETVVSASLADPEPLKEMEQAIHDVIQGGSEIQIVTTCPHKDRDLELTLSIKDRLVQQSYGIHNWPDGEVFTSPDSRSSQGEIYFDLPVMYGGSFIQGIYLRLDKGRIVEYSAERGGEQLANIIETDRGSHRLGEVALGMNPGLHRVLSHPLFVEKVGGTLHIAIGASYAQCYVEDPGSEEGSSALEALFDEGQFNRSAQHVDIVTDFREGGCGKRVAVDGKELSVKDGVWVP